MQFRSLFSTIPNALMRFSFDSLVSLYSLPVLCKLWVHFVHLYTYAVWMYECTERERENMWRDYQVLFSIYINGWCFDEFYYLTKLRSTHRGFFFHFINQFWELKKNLYTIDDCFQAERRIWFGTKQKCMATSCNCNGWIILPSLRTFLYSLTFIQCFCIGYSVLYGIGIQYSCHVHWTCTTN